MKRTTTLVFLSILAACQGSSSPGSSMAYITGEAKSLTELPFSWTIRLPLEVAEESETAEEEA